MRRIILYDNRFGDNGKVFPDLNPNQIELLKRYGNKSLEELKSSSCGVIDLSHSHLDSNDRKQLKFFEYHEKDGDCRLDTDQRYANRLSRALAQGRRYVRPVLPQPQLQGRLRLLWLNLP